MADWARILGLNIGSAGEESGRGFGAGVLSAVPVALFVAGGAGAFVAKISEIIMAGVIVGPGDVDTRAARDVNFDG